MTTPSETRAGKLAALADRLSDASKNYNEGRTTMQSVASVSVEVARGIREALAASEPVDYRDAYEGAREDLLDWKGRAQRAEARLRSLGWTGIDASEHPAPEQPGKGEAQFPGFLEAHGLAPQPSDPAEGDALRALIADWRERAKNGPGALNVAAKELEAALSTPPTVSVDDAMVERAARALHVVDDCCFTIWDKLPDYGQDRYRDKARAALTAAQAEADRLRVDAERLDWLQGLPLDADLSEVIHCWQFRGVQYGSLREAMDAAIHAAKTEQERGE